MHSRRVVFSYLKDKETVTMLFNEIAEKIAARPGGYTRIMRTGYREGDNAETCIIELVDYNELLLDGTSGDKAKTKRVRRGSKKKSGVQASAATDTVESSSTTESEGAESKASE
jgi:large subunit ribosomal protein L17